MAKWCGMIGYSELVETSPGVWSDQIIERKHVGDVLRNSSRRSNNSASTNDDLNVNNQISIIADPFARLNLHKMRYIEFMGTKWKITNIDVQYPRLILTVGGVYNGQQA